MKPLYYLFLLFSLIITPLQAKNIVIIGDSLSAGYGINPQKGWVQLLANKLKIQGSYQVINLSTSGDTTSNGLSKLSAALEQYKPEILIIELGANDGIRGLALSEMKKNIETMVQKGKQRGAKVLLLATPLPPNYGPIYLQKFNAVYQEVANHYQIALVPMFLTGVGGEEQLMQSDGLHPNEQAQPIILNHIWPVLQPLL